jgi:hypothetical protein
LTVTFLRNSALILPAGFLVAAFVFLITHSPHDPALAVYPFIGEWFGPERLPKSPEIAFLVEGAALFLLPYALWLALAALVILADRAIFGPAAARGATPGSLTFARLTVFFLLLFSGAVGGSTAFLKRKIGGEAPVGALAVAAAPFLAGALAPFPALVLSLPVAAFLRMRE